MAFDFNFGDEGPNLAGAVFQALGFASMCWKPTPTGVFQPDGAKEAGDALVEFIEQRDNKKLAEARADAERLRNAGSHKPWCSTPSSPNNCACGWRDAARAHDKLRHPANGG